MLQFLIVQMNFLYRIEKLPSYYALFITEHLVSNALQSKSMNWFPYDNGLRQERVK